MDQELIGALLVSLVLMIGVIAGAWLYIRVAIDESDKDSDCLRTIFCLPSKTKPITHIQIARSPSDDDLASSRRNLFLNLENIREGFKFSFKSDHSITSPTTPSGIKLAFKRSLRRLASSPGHRDIPPAMTSPTTPISPNGSRVFPMSDKRMAHKVAFVVSPTSSIKQRRNSA